MKLDAATARLADIKNSTPHFIDFNHPEFFAPAPRLPDFLKALFQPQKHRFKIKKQPCFYFNPLTGMYLAWSDPRTTPERTGILSAKAQRRQTLAALSWEEKVAIVKQMQQLLPKGMWKDRANGNQIKRRKNEPSQGQKTDS